MKAPIMPCAAVKSQAALSLIREVLFPRGCALCEAMLGNAEDAYFGLCRPCRTALAIPPAERGRCSRCGQPLISEMVTCLSCRNGPEHSFDKIIPIYPYTGKYRKVLSAYKFGQYLNTARFFANKFLDGFELLQKDEAITCGEAPDLRWVPVPPKPGKIKKTGWDQIEYLAKRLEKMKVPVTRCLKRLSTESQKRLNKEERLENLKNKILIMNSKEQALPETAILFDDVYTTGATMDACAAALKSGGTKKVYGICLFYD